MFGKNKILKAVSHDGDNLDIVEIFPTLQGEGPYAGHPAVFIRLGGCNLACNFCDTEFDNFKNLELSQIISKTQKLAQNSSKKLVRNLVVITGGEPLRQPIEKLCQELINLGFLVQIETNGTIFRPLPKAVKIICSPKVTNGKYHKIRPDLLENIDAIKFIISKSQADYSKIPKIITTQSNIKIYLQPMDEYNAKKNQENLKLCQELCQESGYLLSLQLHKLLGIK